MNRNLYHNKEEALSSSFYRSVYLEIEEVGWEHLVRLGEDLTYLSFRILDKKGQSHIFELHLPQSYPKCAPSISADVPYVCELKWSITSRLKDVVHQFHEHLEKLQEFWSTLDKVDRSLWVVGPRQPSRATSFRQINLGNECCILLSINVYDPRSLPECRFLGPDSTVDTMKKKWKRNSKKWKVVLLIYVVSRLSSCIMSSDIVSQVVHSMQFPAFTSQLYKFMSQLYNYDSGCCTSIMWGPHIDDSRADFWTKDKSLVENLENLMETSLPGPPDSWKDDQQVECGICYAQCLPINDELGSKSGSGPDYTCDNSSCNRAFHSVCLGDWLRSITTTRQSFDVLFGNCPYCSGPVAVKVDSNG